MGGPAGSLSSRQHSSRGHRGKQHLRRDKAVVRRRHCSAKLKVATNVWLCQTVAIVYIVRFSHHFVKYLQFQKNEAIHAAALLLKDPRRVARVGGGNPTPIPKIASIFQVDINKAFDM